MGLLRNPYKGRASGNTKEETFARDATNVTEIPAEQAHTFQQVDVNQLSLVMYSPEAIVSQVAEDVSRISFGTTASQRYKHAVGDVWANIAPWVLCVGTIAEVFLFMWANQDMKKWDVLHIPHGVVMVCLMAGIVSLEATFAAVSLKSAALRHDAKHRVGGPNKQDKKDLHNHKIVWTSLAFAVSLGQLAFLLGDAQSVTALFAIYAIIRITGTMWGDAYTAFFHVEGPTDEAKALAADERRSTFTEAKLIQKGKEMDIVNTQIQAVMRTQSKNESEMDSLKTELAIKKQENQTRIETMQSQAKNAQLMSEMGNDVIRAIFDTKMDPDEKAQRLAGLQALMSMSMQQRAQPKELPQEGEI